MNIIFKTTALAIATSSLLFAGCGGSSSSGGDSSSGTQASGKVVDFYLKDASILFKDCIGSSTTLTDDEGGFKFPKGCNSSEITVLGGMDIGTGLPFNGELRAPAHKSGFAVVSPLTTIISSLGGDSGALARVATQLGMKTTNILTTDPMTNADLLRKTVVAQVLMNQVQNVLLKLSEASGGQLTAQQAAQAAAAGMANQFKSNPNGSIDFTSTTTISNIVEAAVKNLADNRNITAFGETALRNSTALAQNTAAVSAEIIQNEVAKADEALKNIDIKGNPTATLQALGNKLSTIKDANNSQIAADVVTLVAPALYDINNKDALQDLGNAIANGSDADVETAFAPLSSALPAGTLDNLQKLNNNAATYTNYLNLFSVGFNKGTTYGVENAMNAYKSDNGLAVSGGFNNVQLNMTKVGTPFTGNTLEAKVGLSYTINNANTFNIVVDKVNLTFDNSGKLTTAVIPANAAFAFNTTGSIKADNPNMTNLDIDNLEVSNGTLSLPVDVFLNKVASKNTAVASVINAYRPKSGDKVTIHVALTGSTNPVEVGNTVNGSAKAADTVVINTADKSIVGRGVNTKVTVSQ